MAQLGSRLKTLLNDETPYAPADAEEVQQRLDAAATSERASGKVTATPQTSQDEAASEDGQALEPPAFVYVPTRPYDPSAETPSGREIRFELRELEQGGEALAVYTSEELLNERLGRFQPRIRAAVLELLVLLSPLNVTVVINPAIRADATRWTAEDLSSWDPNSSQLSGQ